MRRTVRAHGRWWTASDLALLPYATALRLADEGVTEPVIAERWASSPGPRTSAAPIPKLDELMLGQRRAGAPPTLLVAAALAATSLLHGCSGSDDSGAPAAPPTSGGAAASTNGAVQAFQPGPRSCHCRCLHAPHERRGREALPAADLEAGQRRSQDRRLPVRGRCRSSNVPPDLVLDVRAMPKDFDQAREASLRRARKTATSDHGSASRHRQVGDRRLRHGHMDPGPVPGEPRLVGKGRRDTTRRSRGDSACRVGSSRLISTAARRWDPPTRRAASERRLRTTLAAQEPAGWRARCARPTRRTRSPGSRARCPAG